MLAVSAERTRMHSRPSRNTRTAMSSVAAVRLVLGVNGWGAPPAVIACQTRTAAIARRDNVRNTGHPRHAGRSVRAGGAQISAGTNEMLLTLTLMTSRLYLTKMQNKLPMDP